MMEASFMLYVAGAVIVTALITYLIVTFSANKKIGEYKSVQQAVESETNKLKKLAALIISSEDKYKGIKSETKALQDLKRDADSMQSKLKNDEKTFIEITENISRAEVNLRDKQEILKSMMSKIDVYSRLDNFVDVGHYEIPAYLYETSARFAEEIKRVREDQKELIREKDAVICDSIEFDDGTAEEKRIINGQIKLMLSAFNIEVDSLIGKVNPANFSKILERIEKLANTLEKSASTLHCGFNLDYIKLKFEECRLQYQYTLKKKEEQDEQKLIREQIREEQKAIKEFEKAVADSEKEEGLYRELLKKAQEQLEQASEADRLVTKVRIEELEAQLAEAKAKGVRAKSMAEQTRKGHVYVISNVGSFGDDVYKIGLTRRLEPMDRIKELGDASVPFPFDVHAMIYVDDAPALETALHKEFTGRRVNAVNMRKEFFRTDLDGIRSAVSRIAGVEADFKMTVLAEQYFESKRLMATS